MHPVFTGIKKLNNIQSKVCSYALGTNKNMLVCAPTSSGKTNIALLSILRVMSEFMGKNGVIDISKFKIVYIAPMKALVA
jgi:replicative superfamily II helicase